MKCPKCGREMEEGFLQCDWESSINWVSKVLPFVYNSSEQGAVSLSSKTARCFWVNYSLYGLTELKPSPRGEGGFAKQRRMRWQSCYFHFNTNTSCSTPHQSAYADSFSFAGTANPLSYGHFPYQGNTSRRSLISVLLSKLVITAKL